MKLLGMLGGTGPESTVDYYRLFISIYQETILLTGLTVAGKTGLLTNNVTGTFSITRISPIAVLTGP